MKTTTLNNGVEMPLLGYGVFKVDPAECERCVTDAISCGYRLIDTAQFYLNEEGVGNAVVKSGIPREEFFIVTKVWICNSGEEKAMKSIEESLRKLRTDYADMILVHQPFGDCYGTYRALEKAVEKGMTRALGLSNFRPDRYYDIVHHTGIVPQVVQLETNIFSQQTASRNLAAETGTKVMAWGPMAQGKGDFANCAILNEIASGHGKTPVQTALRFLLQEDIPAIPKSTHKERMAENIDIFDFSLNDKEMEALRSLNRTDGGTRDYTDLAYATRIIGQL